MSPLLARALSFLKEALNVREGEGLRVLSLAGYLVLTVSTFITGRIQRDSLFLSAFDKEDLAWMYISVAVMVPVPALLFSRVADRFRRDRLLIWSLLATVVVMGVMRLLLLTDERAVYVLLYNFVEVYGTFLILQFWTFAGDLFSSREAKRLFPIVSAGSVVAGILCGFAVSGVVKLIGTENLLLVQMALLVGAAGIIRSVGHRERARLREVVVLEAVGRQVRDKVSKEAGAPARAKTRVGVSQQASNVLASKHLKIVAGMTIATFITVPLVDYQFKVLVKEHFTTGGVVDTDAISSFMGLFSAMTGVIAAVMQLAFTGRILERFGVVAALLLLPVTLLGGLFAGLLSVASAFACAVFTKGAENSFRYSITDATMQVLYTPVPSQARGRAKTFIDAVLKPIAGGLAGAAMVLLVGPLKLPLQSLAIVAVVLVACWIGLILLIRREYVNELLSTLRRRRLHFGDRSLTITDAPTVAVLRERLGGSDARDVRNAIELCRRVQGHDLSVELTALLQRPDPLVRRATLELLADRSAAERAARVDPAHIEALFVGEGVDDGVDDDVRAAAVSAYCAIVGENALPVVEPMLHAAAPAIRGAAVAGIIRFGGLEGILHAADDLKAMLAAQDEGMRFACAQVLQEIGIRGFHGPVQALLADDSLRVQLAAIAAAGTMKSPELVPSLIYKLRQRETARAAQTALAAWGDDVIDALVRVVRQPREDATLRRAVPRVLERIGSRAALDALLSALFVVEDDEVRRELARACARLRDRLGVAVDEGAVKKLIDAELGRHYQLLAMMADLQTVAGDRRRDLLRDALEARAWRSLDGVFRLLAIVQPYKAIDTIWGNLRSTSAVSRANAIEVLDNLLDSDEKRGLLPLVEATGELQDDGPAAARALARLLDRGGELYRLERRAPEQWLKLLLEGKDEWLVVCALFTVTELGLAHVNDAVEGHLRHKNPIVRETALSALSVLVPAQVFLERCAGLAEDGHAAVARAATRLLATARAATPSVGHAASVR
jgi:ATP/ADP translocase/HEAT repeat protein